ncbi:MAG: aspartate kinase [Peptococcaceae bacterium]|nr:aspartate kinase [Peptococcaceae bacterium]
MALIVQKYGGTSVADPDRVKFVAEHIAKTKRAGNDVVVVVSAPAGMTDDLTHRALKISEMPNPREMDMLLSTGEQISIALTAMALQELGVPAISFTGPQVCIRTDDAHQKARIVDINANKIGKELSDGKVVVIAGFQGIDTHDEITTLGRGGSDTTAVAIAAAIGADVCEIYTDVDGVYTADPRVVPNATKLAKISYDEMLELASLGAKVLHPRSVEVAKIHDVKLAVRSSFNTHIGGTYVVKSEELEKEYAVTGLACDKNVAKVSIFGVEDRPGIAAEVFTALAQEKISVDMIIQSAMVDNLNDIAFTIAKSDSKRAKLILENLKSSLGYREIHVDDNVVKISAVGAGMVGAHGVAARMFAALRDAGVNIDLISTSEVKISVVIAYDDENLKKAMQAIHDAFELENIE